MSEIRIPGAPALDGLRFRTYAGHADIPAMTRVMNAAVIADDSPEYRSEELVRNRLDHPAGMDPREDVLLTFVGDELVSVSFSQVEDANEGMRQYQSFGYVEPGWRRRGLGTVLLRHQEGRLRRLARTRQQPAPPVLVTWAHETDAGATALARRNGYEQVRAYHLMVRPDMDDIEAPAPPEGIIIRPVARGELRQVWDGMSEAFRDHFGAFDTSEASFRRWSESPRMDPSMLMVAFDGDEVTAGVQGAIAPEENEAKGYLRGWTDPVFTRRRWRRRGLAFACLGQALIMLRDRGMTSAQLDVDTENPHDALGLYRKHRFESVHTETEWHKPLELTDD